MLGRLGIRDFGGLVPDDVFNWTSLLTLRGLTLIVGGGFLVGFGTAYARHLRSSATPLLTS